MMRFVFYMMMVWILGCGRTGYERARAPADAQVDGSADNPANYVFVTSQSFAASTLGQLQTLDTACNALAQKAGVKGIFVAWLSNSTVNAKDRLAGARGWVRMDGKPVVDRADDLSSGAIWYPILLDETRTPVSYTYGNTAVVTGTRFDGVVAPDRCNDWVSNNAADHAMIGSASATFGSWTHFSIIGCDMSGRLYCFGVDKNAQVSVTPQTGPLAFVSSPWSPGGGLAGADAHCQTEAASASKSGTFKALLATTTTTAASRFSEVGDPWVLANGLPLATSRTRFFDGSIDVPITMMADGTSVSAVAWIGATQARGVSQSDQNCQNWTSSSAADSGVYSLASESGPFAYIGANDMCNIGTTRLFCLQDS